MSKTEAVSETTCIVSDDENLIVSNKGKMELLSRAAFRAMKTAERAITADDVYEAGECFIAFLTSVSLTPVGLQARLANECPQVPTLIGAFKAYRDACDRVYREAVVYAAEKREA